ncbi:Uncharacterised protein [uncultured archaeon]|nr:Uncharacterised protein [uncultured archaeon]
MRLNTFYNGGSSTKSTSLIAAFGKESDVAVNDVVSGGAAQRFDIGTFALNSGVLSKTSFRSGVVLRGDSVCTLKSNSKIARSAKGSCSSAEQRGLMLDLGSRLQLLPDMQVDCRDVGFASHSASSAPLDEDKMFYLMSRGLNREKARRAFVAGFVSKCLEGVESDNVKEIAISILLDKFDSGKLSGAPAISMRDLWVAPKLKGDGVMA